MESTCSETLLSSDETEYYLYSKRIKIESNQKSIEKQEQQNLEQSIYCVDTSQHEPMHLSEGQNNWSLEKQSCDTARKTSMREILHFQTCGNQRLPHRLSENQLSAKKLSPENEDQSTIDGISLNIHCQPLETESLNMWSAADTSENVQIRNLPPVQQNNIEQNNNKKGASDLKQNSSGMPINRDFFQMKLNHKPTSDKKWKQQLLQIPLPSDTSSMFSHVGHDKNNSLGKVYSTEEKVYSITDNKTCAERDNKEKKISSSTVPTLKSFKSIQLLEIPNFLLSSISNKINSKMSLINLKETNWKSFNVPSSLMQSQQIHDVQNAKSSIKALTVDSEFKEKNDLSISKQEHSALAEGGRPSATYFRGNSTDVKCKQMFAENYFKDKVLENSDDDDDDDGEKSRIHICISAKNVQNYLLKRAGRKSTNENAEIFPIQSIPVVIESLGKHKLATHCSVHNSNTDISLCEAESKLSTKEIFDFKIYLTKTIALKSNCPHVSMQKFPSEKAICSIVSRKGMVKLKFSFQDMLFGWVKTWPESLYRATPTHQYDNITHWFNFCGRLNDRCGAQELVKSNINRKHNNKIGAFLLAVISKTLKVKILKTIISSVFKSTNTFLTSDGKSMQVYPLCDRKEDQLKPCAENTLRQNKEFYKKNETYPALISSTFMESIGHKLHKECHRRYFCRSLGEEEPTFLKRTTLFCNQNHGLRKGKHSRRHHLLSRSNRGFSTYMRLVSHKNSIEKQILFAKCLIFLQGDLDYPSLDKAYCCFNITKTQYLLGANLRFWSYFHAHSQLKSKKGDSKYTNQEILVTAGKQNKPNKMFNSFFDGERFKSFVLCENKKYETTGCRKEVRNEVTYTMKKYLSTSCKINADRKECVKSNKLEINSYTFLSKKSFSFFDTYEKIPLTTDSEDFEHITVNQENSVQKSLSEANAVTSSKEVHILPFKSNDVLHLPEQSKTIVEKCSSLLLQDSQANQPEYCKTPDTYSEYLGNEKVGDQNAYLYFENLFPSSSNVSRCITLPLDSINFVNVEKGKSEGRHCRSSSSAKKQKQSEKNHATVQYSSTESPAVTYTCLQLQPKETRQLSLQGHIQINKEVNSEPATLKHLEYVENQENINDEQVHITNESQCENVVNDLIMSYSEDESNAEVKLKMHLPVVNNGSLEDIKDKHLPLENKITYEFELKRKFALVLEELHMFHEISNGKENNLSSLETNSHNYCKLNNSEDIDENVVSVSQEKICIASPIYDTTEEQNIACSNESVLNQELSNENEDHKVFKECCASGLPCEELLHSPIEGGYFDATYKKPYIWNPAFLSCTLREQNYHLEEERGCFLSRDVIRVQPLKTCKGPIRIGLSRKARPKQLHPYLK